MNLIVNSGPQWVHPLDTGRIMRGVIAALLPAAIYSIYLFGFPALYLYAACLFGAAATEAVIGKARGRPLTLDDGSAFLTGLLLAMTLPPTLPPLMAAFGAVFAVSVGKMIFGGLGCNVFNPALVGRAFLVSAFPARMTQWSAPIRPVADALTGATPLSLARFEGETVALSRMFLGQTAGSLGETSVLLLVLGGGWMLARKLADWRIPLAFLGTLFLLSGISHLWAPGRFAPPLYHLFGGGLMLGALFMATDPVTSPVTVRGRWIFGLGCGFFTFLVRNFSGQAEGVAYSILFMNALAPLVNRLTMGPVFGARGRRPRGGPGGG